MQFADEESLRSEEILHEVRSEAVNDGAESKSTFKRRCHIRDVNVSVTLTLFLTPHLECLHLGCHGDELLLVTFSSIHMLRSSVKQQNHPVEYSHLN